MKLTDSVRSFQVPATPGTSAWPPSLPSVPTSRATRVTSSANDRNCSTIVFTVVPIRRNSPFTGWPPIVSAIFWERSPSATAPSTRATSVVGRTRSSIRAFSESTLAAHDPPAPPSAARSVIRPSRPTILPTRITSRVIWSLRSIKPLKAAARSAITPGPAGVSRAVKSPSRAARSARSNSERSASATSRPLAGGTTLSSIAMSYPRFVSLRPTRSRAHVPTSIPLSAVPQTSHLSGS